MRVTVVGSINLDLVASAPHLPRAGETVTGATLARHPGGKGANQALAAQRLGAEVCMIGRVGRDGMAEEAMALLLADDVDVAGVVTDAAAPTGVALIAVDPDGENQIVVAAGEGDGGPWKHPEHVARLRLGHELEHALRDLGVALPADQLDKALALLKAEGENAWHIGHIAKAADGEEQVIIK